MVNMDMSSILTLDAPTIILLVVLVGALVLFTVRSLKKKKTHKDTDDEADE